MIDETVTSSQAEDSKRSSRSDEEFYRVQARHVRQCAKEVWVAASIWLLTFVYITTVCIGWGYPLPEEQPDVPAMVLGVPAWVFWAVLVPWFVLVGVAWCFSLFVLKEDEPYLDMPDKNEKP